MAHWSRRSLLSASLGLWASAGCAPGASGPPAAVAGDCATPRKLEAQGFDPEALKAYLATFSASPDNFHALLIERGGDAVAEVYRRGRDAPLDRNGAVTTTFDACALHDVRSISKSVTSLLWGIAAAEGKAPALATPLTELYPKIAALRSDGRDKITIAHLLTMSAGLKWDEENYGSPINDEFGLYWHASQPGYAFNRALVAEPGKTFNYNGACTAVIADLLVRDIGMPLTVYAQEKLFAPLGIGDWSWVNDYRGRPLAFAGLRMRPRDLARIGRMMLDHGVWEGRQVVPADWIAASIAPQIATGDGLHYGYFWWLGEVEALGTAHAYVAGFGNGGQRLFLVPSLDVTVVITAGHYNSPKGRLSQQVFRDVMTTLRA